MPAKPNTFIGEALPMQKRSFVRTGEPNLVNYEFVNFIESLGYVKFFLSQANVNRTGSSPNAKLILTTNQSYTSGGLDGSTESGGGSFYSSVFSKNFVLGGIALFNISYRYTVYGGIRDMWVGAVLKKVSSSVTTTIATFPSVQVAYSNSWSGTSYGVSLSSADIQKTIIKKGDYLILEVSIGGNAETKTIFVDPMKTDPNSKGPSFLLVPTKLEI